MQSSFTLVPAEIPQVPILVSIPHCGTAFPSELSEHFIEELANKPDDTDFYVDRLYDFLPQMGITTICAHYSRWVIDLNRSPENAALYDDGRIITDLTPTTDFLGNPIYVHSSFEPDQSEVERRKEAYFRPYHHQIRVQLDSFKKRFGKALLWDAHSIRRNVPTIQENDFPDLILGTNDGTTAGINLIQKVKDNLSKATFELSYNHPFKGGFITRHFGHPSDQIHAIQLEMSKDLYMDDSETYYHQESASKIRPVLVSTFQALIKELSL